MKKPSAVGATCVQTPTSRCRFGISRRDITPPVGIYHRMWGAALHDQARGIHRPLIATALAFQASEPSPGSPDDGPQVILAVDHCLLWASVMDEVLKQTSALSGIPESNLVFTFSHTHSGGNLDPDRAGMPGTDLIAPYVEELIQNCAAACREAVVSLQPAALTYATVECGLARNRDFWDAERGQYVCGYNPDGVADQSLLVVRATNELGELLATIVNYACHSTTLAWQNELISPDYIGALRAVVEQTTHVPCAFLLSPCGDVGPEYGFVGDPEVADKNGRQVGFAALSALESMPAPEQDYHYVGPVFSGATLGIWEYRNQTALRQATVSRYRSIAMQLELPYLEGLGTLEEVERDLVRLIADERAALAAGSESDARTARAQVERKRRLRARLRVLPPGKMYPIKLWVRQLGDAFWVLVEGEPYNWLQAELRSRFAGHPVVIATLANGARACYLPTRESYGKPIYQVDIALLAAGGLEAVATAVIAQIETLLRSTSP